MRFVWVIVASALALPGAPGLAQDSDKEVPPEKQIDFNGLFLMVGEHKILVDPPPMTAEASTFIRRNGPVTLEIFRYAQSLTRKPVKGMLTVPETPGLGLDPKPEIIKEYRMK